MFAYDELKKRIPERDELMTGEEAVQYFKQKTKPGIGLYTFLLDEIEHKTNFRKGKVLDVGSGGGKLLLELRKKDKALQLTGIDGSKTLIEKSKTLLKHKNITLRQGNAEKLPFKKERFDLVICQDTFHHFKKPKKAIKEMLRTTKKGGTIYLTDLRRDVSKEIITQEIKAISAANLTFCQYYIASVKAAYTISEVKKIFKEIGIKNYVIKNGYNSKSVLKIINKLPQKEREFKKMFLKERWYAVIKK